MQHRVVIRTHSYSQRLHFLAALVFWSDHVTNSHICWVKEETRFITSRWRHLIAMPAFLVFSFLSLYIRNWEHPSLRVVVLSMPLQPAMSATTSGNSLEIHILRIHHRHTQSDILGVDSSSWFNNSSSGNSHALLKFPDYYHLMKTKPQKTRVLGSWMTTWRRGIYQPKRSASDYCANEKTTDIWESVTAVTITLRWVKDSTQSRI